MIVFGPQVLAHCHCAPEQPDSLAYTTWLTISGVTVEEIINHWVSGHRVQVRRSSKGQIVAIATLLSMTGWKPGRPKI